MRTLKATVTTLLLLVCLSPGVQAQDFLTITWKSELGCIETPIDSVQVTNLTKNWTTTVFYPEQSIKLYTSVGINEVADFASRQILVKPNPFSQTAEVNFYVGKEGMVHVRLYDIFGRTVASLSQNMDCGTQQLLVNAGSSGHYFLSIETPTDKRIAKLLSTPARHSELVSESLTYKGIAGQARNDENADKLRNDAALNIPPFGGAWGGLPQKSDADLPFSIGDSMQFIAFVTDTNGNIYAYPPQSCKIFADQELLFIYNPLPHVRIAWTAEFNCGHYPLDSVVISDPYYNKRAVFYYPDTAYIHENMGIFQYGRPLVIEGFINKKGAYQYKKEHIVNLSQDTLIRFVFFDEQSFVDTNEIKVVDSIVTVTRCFYNGDWAKAYYPSGCNRGNFLIINTQSDMDSVLACDISFTPPVVDWQNQTLILVRGGTPTNITYPRTIYFIKTCSENYVIKIDMNTNGLEGGDNHSWMVIVNEVIQSNEQVKLIINQGDRLCY